MCGFAGFLAAGPARGDQTLEQMLRPMSAALYHRGPDDDGVWTDLEAGIALAHRRLSIVDLSPLGHQPMESGDGRYIVAFNGEIYNFRELREILRGSGHSFRGTSDTEVLLAAAVEWGVSGALDRFRGMFAFALWDRAERALYLCRDRVGEKPLYYGWSGGTFLFGSELKALREHPAWTGELDRDALDLYLRRCYVPAPYSVYRGIQKLPPGTFLRLAGERPGQLPQPTAYWSARNVVEAGRRRPYQGSAGDAVEELDGLLRSAVRDQMVADVPLGAFLSGGIDSSTVVALMQAQSAEPVKTFTIGFHEQGFNEAEYGAAVARHLGTDHTELYVTSDQAMAVIPRLPTLYDEPFADSSQIPTFLVSELARQSVTVSLSGDGGDELFGGYVRHKLGPKVWRAMRPVPRPLRRAAGAALTAVPPRVWVGLASSAGRLLPRALKHRFPGEKIQKLAGVLRAGDQDAIYRWLVSGWPEGHDAVIGAGNPRDLLREPSRWPQFDDFAARMMYLDLMTYLPDDILVKVDRAAMGVSLETRVPFLDPRVLEFAWRLPPDYKIREGVGKWPLRQVLYRYVPEQLLERPKAGFAVPVGEWLRGPLRDWAEDLLDERRLREGGVFRPGPVRDVWREHLSAASDRTFQLWCILMFQAWEDATRPAAVADLIGT
jgi:asparagine synthase (glutamine-hydrolysing)